MYGRTKDQGPVVCLICAVDERIATTKGPKACVNDFDSRHDRFDGIQHGCKAIRRALRRQVALECIDKLCLYANHVKHLCGNASLVDEQRIAVYWGAERFGVDCC